MPATAVSDTAAQVGSKYVTRRPPISDSSSRVFFVENIRLNNIHATQDSRCSQSNARRLQKGNTLTCVHWFNHILCNSLSFCFQFDAGECKLHHKTKAHTAQQTSARRCRFYLRSKSRWRRWRDPGPNTRWFQVRDTSTTNI